MATMPQRFQHDRDIDRLVREYQRAGRDISQLLRRLTSIGGQPGQYTAETQQILNELSAETDLELRSIVAAALYESSDKAAQLVKGLPLSNTGLAAVQAEAVDQLYGELTDSLMQARNTVRSQVKAVIHNIGRREVLLSLLGDTARDSRIKTSEQLAASLRQQGITGFVDKAGKRWKLDTYAEMFVRTKTREAVTQGAVTRYAAHGVTMVQISSHASSCQICEPLQGRVMRLDGQLEAVNGVNIYALQLPPFHPNCRHVVLPYIP